MRSSNGPREEVSSRSKRREKNIPFHREVAGETLEALLGVDVPHQRSIVLDPAVGSHG